MNRDEFRIRLAGPIPSIRTPFLRGGEIDFPGLRNQVEFCLQAGAGALMLTMGDSHLICLSDAEIAEVTRVTCEQARGRALVIAADRYHATSRSVEFARYAKSVGADLMMCAPPDWGHSCTPDSLAEHYAAVARELPVNLVTGVFIPRGAAFALETIRKAFDRSERVVAIKDDFCGDFAQKLCLAVGHRAAIYAGGMKQNHLSMWPFGGVCGYLASFITFKPDVTHAYWRAIQANDLPAARRIIRDIDNPWLDHLMTYPGGFDAPMHGLGEVFGITQRWRRPPYTSLADADIERLRDFMARLPKP
jgi:4-hydroxy-tetrahydrodipicolinate synthase